jgi:Tetratricopeptide repeat
LGYNTQLPFDPVELYRVQGRLEEAKQVFRQEVAGRRDSLGAQSKSYISLLSTLALIEVKTGNLQEAESVSRRAVGASRKLNGEDSHDTIGAENYLAYILFRRARFTELESLQLELIPRKIKHKEIGEAASSTLNSQNYLVVAYYFQEKYEECLQLAYDNELALPCSLRNS